MARFILAVLVMAVTVEFGSADFLWTPNNCPANVGNVTDKLCCGADTFCRKLVTEVACNSDTDDAALYCEWEDGQCQPVADRYVNQFGPNLGIVAATVTGN